MTNAPNDQVRMTNAPGARAPMATKEAAKKAAGASDALEVKLVKVRTLAEFRYVDHTGQEQIPRVGSDIMVTEELATSLCRQHPNGYPMGTLFEAKPRVHANAERVQE